MSRGGARKGAGRKKSGITKKIRAFRLTEQEWLYMKDSLYKFRQGNKSNNEMTSEIDRKIKTNMLTKDSINKQTTGLLAHLEALYKQQYGWLLEYRNYLRNESYDKYTLEEIKLHREIINLQILTLVPHLQKINFCYEAKMACSSMKGTFIHREYSLENDIFVKKWGQIENAEILEYDNVNRTLADTFESLKLLQWEVKEIESQLHHYDW